MRRLAGDDVRAFYERHYVPDHAILVIIGDAAAADLIAKAERAFGGWKRGGTTLAPAPAPTRITGRHILLVDKPDATQTHIRIGNTAIARTDPPTSPPTSPAPSSAAASARVWSTSCA